MRRNLLIIMMLLLSVQFVTVMPPIILVFILTALGAWQLAGIAIWVAEKTDDLLINRETSAKVDNSAR